MIKIVSYATPLVFLTSGATSLAFPDSPNWIMLAYVLASPLFLIWLAVYERT